MGQLAKHHNRYCYAHPTSAYSVELEHFDTLENWIDDYLSIREPVSGLQETHSGL